MSTLSQLRHLGLFDARAPRYTSYPPATQFGPSIKAEQVGGWIDTIPAGSRISLYLHVPFCRRLCWFCACRTQGTQSLDPVLSYVETLLAELALLRTRIAPGVMLSRLHWGGGTPTLLPPDQMRRLADAVLEAFPMAADGEFSVEIDPSEIDAPRMAALAAAGMNRASIGVQDFDPLIQKTIGRQQSFEMTGRAVSLIRDHGIVSLNADILYGLPHQDIRRMSDTVQKLLALGPDRVALYGYAHVPWMSKRQVMIPDRDLPDNEARLSLFDTARDLFLSDGYDEIGIDHFARPSDPLATASAEGRLRRNFQGYTDDRAEVLIGLGASSISRYPQGYAQNAPATAAYVGAVRSGKLATSRGHAFSGEDLWRGRMIEALMCDFRISSAEMRQDYGLGDSQLQAVYAPLISRFGGMLDLGPDGPSIPPEGRPLTRLIAMALDGYAVAPGNHSPAV